MPAEVKLRDVQDGAVLAEDVLDARGNALLTAGTRLTRAHISLIGRRGVKAVTVMGPEDLQKAEEEEEGVDPHRLADALADQQRAFALIGEDPLMAAIYRAARAHLEAGNLPPG